MMSRGARYFTCISAAIFTLLPLNALLADTVWNAYDQFNATSNTSTDMWQYLSVVEGANTDYALLQNYNTQKGSDNGWQNATDMSLVSPIIDKRTDLSALWVLPYVDNSSVARAAAIGWKSPITGQVNVSFSVTDVNYRTPTVDPVDNGVSYALFASGVASPLATGTIDATNSTGTIALSNVSVTTGNTLYLQIGPRANGTGNAYYWDGTAVNFSVASVPEPSTVMLLATGFVGLLAYAWRKRK